MLMKQSTSGGRGRASSAPLGLTRCLGPGASSQLQASRGPGEPALCPAIDRCKAGRPATMWLFGCPGCPARSPHLMLWSCYFPCGLAQLLRKRCGCHRV